MNISEKKVSVRGSEAKVYVKLAKRKGKNRRVRVYTETALAMLLEEHPNLDVAGCINPETVNNDSTLEHEWVFRLRAAKPSVKKKKSKRLTKVTTRDTMDVKVKSEQDEVSVGEERKE